MALNSSRRRDMLQLAAVRQSRERQQGVDVSQGYLRSTDAGLMFEGPRTFEIFFKYEFIDHSQYIGGFQSPTISVVVPYNERERDLIYMYCGATYVWLPITSGNYYHAVISYDGSESVCYLNGVEVGRKSFEGDVASLQFRIGAQSQPPKGPIHLCRHYNYALSAQEVAALYNNGDPAGYVLPGAYKRPGNSYVSNFTTSTERWTALAGSILTYDEANHVLELDSVANRSAHMFSPVSYDTRDSHVYDIEVVIDANPQVTRCDFYPYTATELITLPVEYLEETTVFRGVYIPGPRNSFSDNIYCYFSLSTPTIVRVRSIRVLPVDCVAEYLPQNLIVASKQDFPQVVFPDGVYTPGANVFGTNDPALTAITNDNPASHGFSGSFQRGEAIISLGIRCAFHNRSENIDIPIKLTVEYRSNISLYQYTGQGLSAEPLLEPNEGDAKIATFVYGAGNGFLMGKSSVAGDWLEIRTLSIEVAEGAVLSWLDSAKQLPMNDEYLPPLLETAGGYNLTANEIPEIVYKPE